jgi:excisionase family DNA binding protein
MTELLAQVARLHTVESVMERLCLGRSKTFELIASGELRSIKVGRRRLISEAALAQYITELDADGGNATPPPSEAPPPQRQIRSGGSTSPRGPTEPGAA